MGDDDGRVTHRPRLRGLYLLAMILSTLALGLVAGYLIRAATEPGAAPPASPSASPAQPATPPPPAAPCVAAAERGEDLLAEIERAVRAIAALDPSALRVVVDEVELLHAQLQRAVDACGAEGTRVPGAGPGPPTAAVPGTPG